MILFVFLLVSAGFLFTILLLSGEKRYEAERKAEMERRNREMADLGPMALYLSTGAIPTGRTAEILFLAQEARESEEE